MINQAGQTAEVIAQTKNWIRELVIGCNFCPFAAREVKRDSIRYQVVNVTTVLSARQVFLDECKYLDRHDSVETTLIIFPAGFETFDAYLALTAAVEKWLQQKKYNGIYQVASFHPLYQFANADGEDAANYTNRSLYPMLHLLREKSIRKALAHYTDPENIPVRNVAFARDKGMAYMKMLRDSCF
ncbi:DUF1415 domain-containing protein [Chitinophaga nivalis]|uniref:DUF1415 domain-containing protein n=1 Tax=Chitinophaga nivalis TaxID=2991709 RepID=A0ABT3IR26_9BACT|nr:DUF1415 domain-containing protein [Chitinophaga nivalis]MCW3463900.1 DUF1415 domain-containing protein [Chitinophaga nivalis]MCW3486410.1 DUF1415 domain-containing protein [Chitinophaga nivalis]